MLRRAAFVLAAVIAALVPAQAQAAFPGANGRIFFVSDRDGNAEIYSMHPNGSDVLRLTNNPATDDQPAVSPDGTQVAFVSDRIGGPATDIWIMNADGTGQRRVTTNTRAENDPAFLPNGRILYRSGKDGDYEIYSSNTTGGAEVQLTVNTTQEYFPAASPNGQKIAYTGEAGPDLEIYAMNASGSGQTRLTIHDGLDARPNWAPDNSKIAYFSDLGTNTEIMAMSASGAVTNLTQHWSGDTTPAFSPNGNKVAFTTTRDEGNAEIYVMQADGSGQTRVTTHAAGDYDPDWAPVPVTCATPGGITDANDATPGNGVVQGTSGWDFLKGGPGHETLDGKAGNDVLCGGGGADTLLGGPGPTAGADADKLIGQTGNDVADYASRTGSVILDLNPSTDLFAVEGETNEGDNVSSSVESGRTGAGADVLRGNTAANAFFAGDGADNINPGSGRDYVDAGAGDDAAINVRDDEADTVICGTGFDPFSATEFDPIDSLAADCEQG